MLTSRLYVTLVGCASVAAVASVSAIGLCRHLSQEIPTRPKQVAATAVWRPTPSDSVPLTPHGDWVSCSGGGALTHCELTDAQGTREFEGAFQTLPEQQSISKAQLRPIASQDYSPWMWSARLGRMVPVIHLEDGTVLAPRESAAELRGYVARIRKFTARLGSVPVYAAEEQPRASMPEQDFAAR